MKCWRSWVESSMFSYRGASRFRGRKLPSGSVYSACSGSGGELIVRARLLSLEAFLSFLLEVGGLRVALEPLAEPLLVTLPNSSKATSRVDFFGVEAVRERENRLGIKEGRRGNGGSQRSDGEEKKECGAEGAGRRTRRTRLEGEH